MNNYSKIYWLTRLDYINSLFIILLISSILALFVYYLVKVMDCLDEKDRQEYKANYGKIKTGAFYTYIISILIVVFIPTKNDMIMIYAGGKTMNYVQSDTSLKKIPYQTTQIISEYLDKSIKEIKDDNK